MDKLAGLLGVGSRIWRLLASDAEPTLADQPKRLIVLVEDAKSTEAAAAAYDELYNGAPVFCLGQAALESFRASCSNIGASPDLIPLPTIDLQFDNDLKVFCGYLANASLSTLSPDELDDIGLDELSVRAISAALRGQLFMLLRAAAYAFSEVQIGQYDEIVYMPRRGPHIGPMLSALNSTGTATARLELGHLDEADRGKIDAEILQDRFAPPRAFRTLPQLDLSAASAASRHSSITILASLTNFRSASLCLPVVSSCAGRVSTTLLINNPIRDEVLDTFRRQFGLRDMARVHSKDAATSERVTLPPDSPLSKAVRRCVAEVDELELVQVSKALSYLKPLVVGHLRLRLPALLNYAASFRSEIGTFLRRTRALVVTPGDSLEALIAVDVANKIGVPTLELQRGLIAPEPRLLAPAANHVLATDEYSRQVYVDYLKLESDRVTTVGSLKLDTDVAAARYLTTTEARAGFSEFAEFAAMRVLLLATQPLPDDRMTQIVGVVSKALATAGDIALIIKLHPEEPAARGDQYKAIAREHGLDLVAVHKALDLPRALVASDFVATYFSTVGLEAFALRRPLIVINPWKTPPPFDLHGLGTAYTVSTADELRELVSALNASPDAVVDGPLSLGSSAGCEYLRDGRSALRIVDFMLVAAGLSERVAPWSSYDKIITDRELSKYASHLHDTQGPAAAVELLNSSVRFESEQRRMLAAYPKLALGSVEAAFEGFVHRARYDRSLQLPANLEAWDGKALGGKMLVWAQPGIGLGAEIMHMGFLPALKQIWPDFLLVCDDRLVPVVQRSFVGLEVIGRSALPGLDYDPQLTTHTSIMSLGWISRLVSGGFDRPNSFILPRSDKAHDIRQRYVGGDGKLPLGIAWKTTNQRGGARNVRDLERFLAATRHEGRVSISLQHGVTLEEENYLRSHGVIVDNLIDPIRDVEGLIDQIYSMDAIATTPNSVVHLAGSLGVPVTLLLPEPAAPEWRGKLAETLWYKSVNIIRYKKDSEEERALERMSSVLSI